MKIQTLLASTFIATSFAEPKPMEFLPLFNNEDLSGWSGEGYVVEDEAIVCTPKGKVLSSNRRFANYVLDFEFKLTEGANNGLAIHYPGEGNPADTGMELQILDNTADKYSDLKPSQYHGSIYSLLPAKRGALKPVGEWNLQRVIINGHEVTVELNGERITNGDRGKLQQKFPEHAGIRRNAGQIGFCGHGSTVSFRRPRICEIPPAANVDGVRAAGFMHLSGDDAPEKWKIEPGSEGHWRMLNRMIQYDGLSNAKIKHLWSRKSYRDFTLVFDWRWSGIGNMEKRPVFGPDGEETSVTVEAEEHDSGIYLRGSSKSQVNLWSWPAGSGEIHGYRIDKDQPAEVRAAATPKVKADNPLGEWNRTMISLKGDRLNVLLNNVTVIEDAKLPGIPEEGPIALQHHGSSIDFANIWIRED